MQRLSNFETVFNILYWNTWDHAMFSKKMLFHPNLFTFNWFWECPCERSNWIKSMKGNVYSTYIARMISSDIPWDIWQYFLKFTRTVSMASSRLLPISGRSYLSGFLCFKKSQNTAWALTQITKHNLARSRSLPIWLHSIRTTSC